MSRQKEQHILIIGAGIGGLMLAQGLKKLGRQFLVFEKDKEAEAFAQSWKESHPIRIPRKVYEVLEQALPPSVTRERDASACLPCPGECLVNAVGGIVEAYTPSIEGHDWPYMVDSAVLRRQLLEGLDDHVRWGMNFREYKIEDGSVKAYFENGAMSFGRSIVGADGAASRVHRQLLPDHHLLDTGSAIIYGRTPFNSELCKKYPFKYQHSTTVFQSRTPLIERAMHGDNPVTLHTEPVSFPNRSKCNQELPEDYIRWTLHYSKKLLGSDQKPYQDTSMERESGIISALTAEWDDAAKLPLEKREDSCTATADIFTYSPSLPEWTSSAQVTLLGDAIHRMSPIASLSALTTIKSAIALIQATKNDGFTDATVAAYEDVMRKHAAEAIAMSEKVGMMMSNQRPSSECSPVAER